MSGVEIAGIVLGALPILFLALDGYKNSISRMGQGFRKRKTIEKLSRALRMQRQTLIAIIKQILLESGCDSLPSEDAQVSDFLNEQDTKDRVSEYLGEDNDAAFEDAIAQCFDSVQRATARVTAYIPSLKVVATVPPSRLDSSLTVRQGQPGIRELIDSNNTTTDIEWRVRIALVISANDVNDEIKALDASIDTLDRFSNNLRRLRHLEEALPSQKATRLAKSLRAVRRYTQDLHDGLSQCWKQSCHVHHEAKLFLDARLSDALKRTPRKESTCQFRIVLYCKPTTQVPVWHETTVHAEDDDDSTPNVGAAVNTNIPQVRIVAAPAHPSKPKPALIQDLCIALKKAESDKKHPVFHLMVSKKIGMSLNAAKPFTPSKTQQSMTLRELLDDANGAHQTKCSLPLHARMLLALTLSSTLLQCLNTPWSTPVLSASNIHFLLQGQNKQPDLRQPYLSVNFNLGSTLPQPSTSLIKTSLQELGILLLEIWHTTPFETKYPTNNFATANSHRLAYALDWLDEVQNPLLDHYYTAVTNCIVRVLRAEARMPDWDDHKLWRTICDGVIEPLHKIVQQWSSGP